MRDLDFVKDSLEVIYKFSQKYFAYPHTQKNISKNFLQKYFQKVILKKVILQKIISQPMLYVLFNIRFKYPY
jgi:hypothetical protein